MFLSSLKTWITCAQAYDFSTPVTADLTYEAARAIRAFDDPTRASIPILAVSADAFEEDRQKALRAGMNGHLHKPIDIDLLFQTLDSLLAESKDE